MDADLRSGDVRLTMGGEPTFVSLDDPDGAEWTTAALGPKKLKRAVELLGTATPAVCARRLAAFWAGEMVSRRAAAALGLWLLLAQGWRSHLGGYQPDRRGRQGLRLHCGACAAVSGGAHAPSAGGRRIHHCRIRKEKILNKNRCIIIVTHDARINEYADRILHMEDGVSYRNDQRDRMNEDEPKPEVKANDPKLEAKADKPKPEVKSQNLISRMSLNLKPKHPNLSRMSEIQLFLLWQ